MTQRELDEDQVNPRSAMGNTPVTPESQGDSKTDPSGTIENTGIANKYSASLSTEQTPDQKGVHEKGEQINQDDSLDTSKESDDQAKTLAIPEADDRWIDFNIGGKRFSIKSSNLQKYPNTVLSDLTYGDESYDSTMKVFRFDRNPDIFTYILDYYRTGELHFPHQLCGPTVKKELRFWRIDENEILPCCWSRYKEFDDQMDSLEKLGKAFSETEFSFRRSNMLLLSTVQKWRERVWKFLEDPTSSKLAQLWAVLYMLMVIGSVLTLCLDTNEEFRVRADYSRLQNPNETNKKIIMRDTTHPHPAIYISEFIFNTAFLVVLAFRLLCCPNRTLFFKSLMNWIDLIVIVSQWIVIGIALQPEFWTNQDMMRAYTACSVIRIFRVFFIFKLARHYVGLKILLLALGASIRELSLLVVFVVIAMVIFSTLIFYAEFDEMDNFNDIPTGFWWAIITMTTVGYGDVAPKSHYGYFVGSLCAIAGMLVTGLPIPIIANNFNLYYNVVKLKRTMDARDAARRGVNIDEFGIGMVTEGLSKVSSGLNTGLSKVGTGLSKVGTELGAGLGKLGRLGAGHVKFQSDRPKNGKIPDQNQECP